MATKTQGWEIRRIRMGLTAGLNDVPGTLFHGRNGFAR
jgi:hypothetical protein